MDLDRNSAPAGRAIAEEFTSLLGLVDAAGLGGALVAAAAAAESEVQGPESKVWAASDDDGHRIFGLGTHDENSNSQLPTPNGDGTTRSPGAEGSWLIGSWEF